MKHAGDANADEWQYVIPAWEKGLDLEYRLRYTEDGQYAHLRTTPLQRALYGFDPLAAMGEKYTWQDYYRETGCGSGSADSAGGGDDGGGGSSSSNGSSTARRSKL